MRYTLRNPAKLIEAFGNDYYLILEHSLDWAIIANAHHERDFEQIESDKPKYKMIQVKELEGERTFSFYVVSITFDCWVLGYKGEVL